MNEHVVAAPELGPLSKDALQYLAELLCQVGCKTIPADLVCICVKLRELNEEERQTLERGAQLIAKEYSLASRGLHGQSRLEQVGVIVADLLRAHEAASLEYA